MQPQADDLAKRPEQLAREMRELVGGSPTNPAFNTQIAMQALYKGACILIVVSRDAEKLSRRVVGLTVALLVLTLILLVFAFPSAVHEYRDTYRHYHHTADADHR